MLTNDCVGEVANMYSPESDTLTFVPKLADIPVSFVCAGVNVPLVFLKI